jgi:hypothetical protein
MKKKRQSRRRNASFEERLTMEYPTRIAEGSSAQERSQEQTHALDKICKQMGDKRAARGKPEDQAGWLMLLM